WPLGAPCQGWAAKRIRRSRSRTSSSSRSAMGLHFLHAAVPFLEQLGHRLVRPGGEHVTVVTAQSLGGNGFPHPEDNRPTGADPQPSLGGDLVCPPDRQRHQPP